MNIKTWHVELFIDEEDARTSARAVLHSEARNHLEGRGYAIRAPHDPSVPEIGDEVAVARALHDLAGQVLAAAAADIEELEKAPVAVKMTP